jgi:hypothetical protein
MELVDKLERQISRMEIEIEALKEEVVTLRNELKNKQLF